MPICTGRCKICEIFTCPSNKNTYKKRGIKRNETDRRKPKRS